MDRKIKNESGFTLIEMIIVLMIISIGSGIAINRFGHIKTVNSINEDMHKISAFFHAQKLLAFSQKKSIALTVAGKQINTIATDILGVAVGGPSLILNNTIQASVVPPTFTISTRGSITLGGNININILNSGAQYSCVQLDNIRIRLGVWNGTCTPI